MPSSATSTSATRARTPASRGAARVARPARRAGAGQRSASATAARVRWDRVGRAAMLCVLVTLVYLYLGAGIHMLSSWRQSNRDSAAVVTMEREHRALVLQHGNLSRQSTLEAQARQLGMMKRGEQPYMIGGLPKN